jgi:hypothetical protein
MRITSLEVRMRSSIALMLVLLGVSPASASVYHLSPSLAGSEVLGPIAGPVPVVLGVTLSGPVPTNPLPGSFVLAYDVYFAKADGTPDGPYLNIGDIGMTIFSGPSGGNGIVTGGGNAVTTDAARFLFFGSGFSHNSGDTVGFPLPNYTITLPDNLSLVSSSGLVIPPIASAIPEVSTWTMMILGFLGIGFSAHRRHNQPSRALVRTQPGAARPR